MERSMTKTYTLTVTQQQAAVLQVACEFLARIQCGQVRQVFDHLPLRKDLDYGILHDIEDNLTERMPEILVNGIDGWRSSLGVGNKNLPPSSDIAWDLYCVIRHRLSWDKAIEKGIVDSVDSPRKTPEMMGVSYDSPMKWGSEPLATIVPAE
jgi:hypothetical protein